MWLRPKFLFESKKAKKHIKGGALAIANHTNFRDPIALFVAFWYRRVHILAMRELFQKKISNWFFRGAQCIPVDRDNFNMQTFRSVTDVLKEGGVVGIFPEGRIGAEKDNVQSFKSGAALMAVNAQVPIVPVYLAPYANKYSRTVIVMGEPIDPKELCGGTPSIRDLDMISQKMREKELELMEVYNKWKTKKSSK